MNFSFSSSSSRLLEEKKKIICGRRNKKGRGGVWDERSHQCERIQLSGRGNSFPSLSHSRKKEEEKLRKTTKENKKKSGHSL